MVYRLPAKVHCSLPIHRVNTAKATQLYSLCRKVNGKYIRIATKAYPVKTAFIVWGETYSMNPVELSIRPVKVECNEAK